MKLKANRSGFTLLEIIIVIIIIGVLASLALPRLFSTVEYSRSAEALASIATIRSSLERCYLINNGSYTNCNLTTNSTNSLDIPDPATSPNAHFGYKVTGTPSGKGYTIIAQRNSNDNGSNDGTDQVGIQLTDAGALTKAGKGAYKAIGNSDASWLTPQSF